MGRYDLTDFEWSIIQPLLPNKPRGVPRVDDRRVLNGIFWVLRTGAPWRDLPQYNGPYTTCTDRNQSAGARQGCGSGLMDPPCVADLRRQRVNDRQLERYAVHQHAAGAMKGAEIVRMGSLSGESLTTKIQHPGRRQGTAVSFSLDPRPKSVRRHGRPNRSCKSFGPTASCSPRQGLRLRTGSRACIDRIQEADADHPPHRNGTPRSAVFDRLQPAATVSPAATPNREATSFNKIKRFRRIATRYEPARRHSTGHAMIQLTAKRWICLGGASR